LAKSVELLVNKKKNAPIQMQWKEDNVDIQSKIVKTMDLFTIEDSLMSSKGAVGKTKSEEVLSHIMEQEVSVQEVGKISDDRMQVSRTSCRQNKATITRSKDLLWQK
jgi:hypothetical protein